MIVALKVILTIVFILLGASHLLTAYNAGSKPGNASQTVVNFIIGTALAFFAVGLWYIPLP